MYALSWDLMSSSDEEDGVPIRRPLSFLTAEAKDHIATVRFISKVVKYYNCKLCHTSQLADNLTAIQTCVLSLLSSLHFIEGGIG